MTSLEDSRALGPAADFLRRRVLGQPQAVLEMGRALERIRGGLTRDGRPRGSFLLLGPTGVGKTEMCWAATEWLWREQAGEQWREHLAKFDMAEFQDAASFARWMGTSGGAEGVFAREVLRLNSRAGGVILLDEVEKAHRDFARLWLAILDEGRFRDGWNRELRLDWIFVLMTSNLGGAGVARLPEGTPRELRRRRMLRQAQEYFGPEGVARFDEAIAFSRLTDATQEQVCTKMALAESERLATRLAQRLERDLRIEPPGPEVLRFLRKEGYTEREGARRMRRVVERELGEAADAFLRTAAGETAPLLSWSVVPRPREEASAGLPARRVWLAALSGGR